MHVYHIIYTSLFKVMAGFDRKVYMAVIGG